VRVLVTGEKGFIGRNLPKSFEKWGHSVVPIINSDIVTEKTSVGEPCVHKNSEDAWRDELVSNSIDLVVHNAAIVGTDVVALYPKESTLTNVSGTYTISRAANAAGVPVCYMGTTVIYDTAKYQNSSIVEDSKRGPSTYYGALKLAGEETIRSLCKEWMIIRPLFAYGGIGDMNSLMAKTFYAEVNDVYDIDMFLDPGKTKDYMRVEDYCDAVALACHLGIWGDDYNVAAETPHNVGKIVEVMSDVCCSDLSKRIKWHPKTDYLGNHILSSEKFRNRTGWEPKFSLRDGLDASWDSISDPFARDESYDPLQYLKHAKTKGIDLTEHY
jgi:dTDP-4-dehydrorhamnose reductase